MEIYEESSNIAAYSPRGAAALLRLCLQQPCIYLSESGKNLNADIANLVQRKLPNMIEQALDIVRVIGNNAVHPGEIDINEKAEFIKPLFDNINLIAEYMISSSQKKWLICLSHFQSHRRFKLKIAVKGKANMEGSL